MRFVFTGPESSGKTTMALKAYATWGGGLVMEYAREYLGNLNGKYTFDDLKKIGFAQFDMEENIANTFDYTWCDTDYLTVCLWSRVRFNKEHTELISLWNTLNKQERFYFLCAPDIPWEYDELRENPSNRDQLFDLNLSLLEAEGLPFTILRGTQESRLKVIESTFDTFFPGYSSEFGS